MVHKICDSDVVINGVNCDEAREDVVRAWKEIFKIGRDIVCSDYCEQALAAYALFGLEPGGWLKAVLLNEPFSVVWGRVDPFHRSMLWTVGDVINHWMPAGSWGSAHAFQRWVNVGGLFGEKRLWLETHGFQAGAS